MRNKGNYDNKPSYCFVGGKNPKSLVSQPNVSHKGKPESDGRIRSPHIVHSFYPLYNAP